MARSKKTTNSAKRSTKGDTPKAADVSDETLSDTKSVAAEDSVNDTEIIDAEEIDPKPVDDTESDTDETPGSAEGSEGSVELEPEPAPEPDVAASPKPQPVERPSVFVPMLIGGLIAGAIGFGAARYMETTQVAPEPSGPSETEIALQQAVEAQTQELQTQTTQIAELVTQIGSLAEENAAKDQALQALQDQIDNLPTPAPVVLTDDDDVILNEEVAAALAAQKDQIASLSSELQAMAAAAKAQMDAAAAEVENIAIQEQRAQARAAVSTIRAALETGAPFAELLPDIANVTDIPVALQDVAETGVPTLSTLQSSFGSAARDALSASRRAQAGETATDRMKLFFQDQLGTRSLVPREGDSPDAVLSRIEAAMKSGDLDAIEPLAQTLPETGQAALSEWTSRVNTRQSAAAAVQSLSDTLAAN